MGMVGRSRGNRGSFAFGLSICSSFNVNRLLKLKISLWRLLDNFFQILASIEAECFICRALSGTAFTKCVLSKINFF